MQQSVAGHPSGGTKTQVMYCGFWSRFISYVIDSLFLGLVALVIGLSYGIIASLDNIEILNTVSTAALLITPLYYVAFWALAGATPGKIMLGIRIVGPGGGMNGIGWGRALLRLLGYIVSSFFYLGFLWIAIDAEHRGWHDYIAGTRVVNV